MSSMKSGTAITLLLSLCVLASNAVRAQSAKLSLATIEGYYFDEETNAIGARWKDKTPAPVDFVVLIENTSNRDIGIYRQWNSDGYFSIHFVVEGPNGKQTVIEKEERGWNYNFPECFRLRPGMTHAVPIALTSKKWKGVEALSAKGARLKAVFQQYPPDLDTLPGGVEIFTNKIESSFVAWDVLTGNTN